jgi:enhancing lycopene biosynthesis protein 2
MLHRWLCLALGVLGALGGWRVLLRVDMCARQEGHAVAHSPEAFHDIAWELGAKVFLAHLRLSIGLDLDRGLIEVVLEQLGAEPVHGVDGVVAKLVDKADPGPERTKFTKIHCGGRRGC